MSVEIAMSPMQTHEVRDIYEQSFKTKSVRPNLLKFVGSALAFIYLVLLFSQPIVSNCYGKFMGTLIFGVAVALTLLRVYWLEEDISTALKATIRDKETQSASLLEVETVSFNARVKIFLMFFALSTLLTFPIDYIIDPRFRARMDCHRYDETNKIKVTGVILMIFNMSLLLGRIVIIKITSLNCLRYLSLRKLKLLKRVSRRLDAAELGALKGDKKEEISRLTFLKPKKAEDDEDGDDFFKALIGKHNEIVKTNSLHLYWLLCVFIAQVGYLVNNFLHEGVLGPNDVQQAVISFLLFSVLALSLMSRLGHISKIYANEGIVNEEAAPVEALSTAQVQFILVTSVTIISTIVGRFFSAVNSQ